MSIFIYPLAAHWAWSGDGWIGEKDYIDFAGSGVVHVIGGAGALVGAFLLGPRYDYYGTHKDTISEKLPLVDLLQNKAKIKQIARDVFDEVGKQYDKYITKHETLEHSIFLSQEIGVKKFDTIMLEAIWNIVDVKLRGTLEIDQFVLFLRRLLI
jgi:hypothetical protein